MSTKTFHAYRLPRDFDIIPVLMDIRKEVDKSLARDRLEKLVLSSTKSADQQSLWINSDYFPVGTERYPDDYCHIVETPLAESSTELVFITHLLSHEDYWYVIASGHLWTERLFHSKMDELGAEPYSYWNSSDHPDDVSDDEWEKRGNTWSKIFTGHNQPMNELAMQNRVEISLKDALLQFVFDNETYEERENVIREFAVYKVSRVIELVISYMFEDDRFKGKSYSELHHLASNYFFDHGYDSLSYLKEKINDVNLECLSGNKIRTHSITVEDIKDDVDEIFQGKRNLFWISSG